MFDQDPAPARSGIRRRRRVQAEALPPVTEIAAAERRALLTWWHRLFGSAAPKGLSQSFLRRFVAFEVQARQTGGLANSVTAQLQRIDTGRERRAARTLQPGARLLREWNGITHVVEVTPSGCLWNGTSYRSLSAVARAITGAQWSGPRFFGLNGSPAKAGAEETRRSARSGHPIGGSAT